MMLETIIFSTHFPQNDYNEDEKEETANSGSNDNPYIVALFHYDWLSEKSCNCVDLKQRSTKNY